MGLGIDWMIAVALFVASLPGAVGRMAAFGTGPLLLCTAGLVLLCLLRSPLRWSGAVVVVAAALWAVRAPLPDVFVADRGDTVAVRGASGRLAVMRTADSDGFAVREWLARRCRCARAERSGAARRRRLRRDRLRRAARRRHDRGAAVRRGGLRGGLPPRRAGGQPAHRAAGCAATDDRPHGVAAHRRERALSAGQGLGDGAWRIRRATTGRGRRPRRARRARSARSDAAAGARCDAARRGSRRGGLISAPGCAR